MKRTSRNSNAFTLIELLVVISIISLLISILLPALGSARKRAQTLQCLSNIRTIGSSMVMYLDDYNYWFPPSTVSGASGLDGHTGWGILKLRPYYFGGYANGMWWNGGTRYPNVAVELCPSNNIKPTAYGYTAVSRGYNAPPKIDRRRPFAYTKPSKTPFMWDSDVYRANNIGVVADYAYPDWWTLRFQYTRHTSSENAWYLDGHANNENETSGALDKDKLWQLHSYNKVLW